MGKRIMGRIQDAEGVDESARMIPHNPTPFKSDEEKGDWGISVVASVRDPLPRQAPEWTRDLHIFSQDRLLAELPPRLRDPLREVTRPSSATGSTWRSLEFWVWETGDLGRRSRRFG